MMRFVLACAVVALIACAPRPEVKPANPTAPPVASSAPLPEAGRPARALSKSAPLVLDEDLSLEVVELRADTVVLSLGGDQQTFVPRRVIYLRGHRVELVRVEGATVHVFVDRVTEQVEETRTLHLQRGDKVRLFDRVLFGFDRHGHKDVMPGQASPLILRVTFDGEEQSISLFPPKESSFAHQDLRFTLVKWAYDDFMDLTIDRMKLERR